MPKRFLFSRTEMICRSHLLKSGITFTLRAITTVVIAASVLLSVHAQELTFDIAEPDTAGLTKHRLWATYYHIWPAKEMPSGVALLDKNNHKISGFISKRDWCMGAIEGTIVLEKAGGNVQTFNYVDHKGVQQVDCSKVLNISSIKKPWISSTGKSRYRLARGPYGDGVLNYKLIPYRTIAVDNNVIPYGSVIYIPQARGAKIILPSGASAVHDGFFYAADTGGAIKGNHIDVFAGTSRSNPFPAFVKSSVEYPFDAFLVNDTEIANQLKALHE